MVLPPSDLPTFPVRPNLKPVFAETDILASINDVLARGSQPTLERMPQLFAADRVIPGDYEFLDPYWKDRPGPVFRPLLKELSPRSPSERQEVFVYLHASAQQNHALMAALVGLRRPLLIYIPGLNPTYRAMLAGRGHQIAGEPVSFDRVRDTAAVIVHAGGHGLACQGLAEWNY